MVAFNQNTDFIVGPWLKKAINRKLAPGEAILGHQAWINLGLLAMDKCTLFGNSFKVVGILDKTGTGFDNCIFVSDENLPAMIKNGRAPLKPNEISIVFVKAKPGFDPKQVATNIESSLFQVSVVPRSDMGKNILGTLQDVKTVFSLTVLLCLALSSLLTWAIFSAIINERMREIGVMRAIGAKTRHIVKTFVIEVFLLGAMGSTAGAGFGTYLAISFSKIFVLFRDMPAGLSAPERLAIALAGIAVGTGVCVLGAVAPIIKIKKMEPLTAIKES
ncbi:MAG: ABC transporter permease [Nitrospiraceae bacterium]|nr:ABC transporter permease [Nitrospiraceae bacterium]MDA8324982.1 ABC transporter permease [Nitrospiraceae bacterium]